MKDLRLWSTTVVTLPAMSGVCMLVGKLLIGHAILTDWSYFEILRSLREMGYHSIKGVVLLC